MRRALTCVVLVALLLTIGIPAAFAGTSTDVALGLASFAVFNQIVSPLLNPHPVQATYHHRREVVYRTVVTPAPVVYAPPPRVVYGPPPRVVYTRPAPVVYAPPVYAAPAPVAFPAPSPTVVRYPNGRYELHQRGNQYVWIWIPAPAEIPPPPPAPRY